MNVIISDKNNVSVYELQHMRDTKMPFLLQQ